LLSCSAEKLPAGKIAGYRGDDRGGRPSRPALEIRDLLLRADVQYIERQSSQRWSDHPRDLGQVIVARDQRRGCSRHRQGTIRAVGRVRVAGNARHGRDNRENARSLSRQYNRAFDADIRLLHLGATRESQEGSGGLPEKHDKASAERPAAGDRAAHVLVDGSRWCDRRLCPRVRQYFGIRCLHASGGSLRANSHADDISAADANGRIRQSADQSAGQPGVAVSVGSQREPSGLRHAQDLLRAHASQSARRSLSRGGPIVLQAAPRITARQSAEESGESLGYTDESGDDVLYHVPNRRRGAMWLHGRRLGLPCHESARDRPAATQRSPGGSLPHARYDHLHYVVHLLDTQG